MNNYHSAVGIVTGVLILFVTLIQSNIAQVLIWGIFLAGPFLILWMVWAVLAAPVEIKETFDEQWYQDRKDLRRDHNKSILKELHWGKDGNSSISRFKTIFIPGYKKIHLILDCCKILNPILFILEV